MEELCEKFMHQFLSTADIFQKLYETLLQILAVRGISEAVSKIIVRFVSGKANWDALEI